MPDVGILLAESRRALERGHDPVLDELAAELELVVSELDVIAGRAA